MIPRTVNLKTGQPLTVRYDDRDVLDVMVVSKPDGAGVEVLIYDGHAVDYRGGQFAASRIAQTLRRHAENRRNRRRR